MRPFRRAAAFAFAAAASLSAFSTNAQTAPARLGLCAGCHGETGRATASATPNLAGQNLDYMRNAIKLYQSGARDVPAMRAAVGMVNAAQLEQVLAWYALAPGPETPTP